MSESMLSLENVDVFYGSSQVLFGVDLALRKGQVMALLGRNGAGKSTTFKAIAGLASPRRGQINLTGRSLKGLAPFRISQAGVAYVPEDRQVFPDHTVHDNLLIGGKPGTEGQRTWNTERIYDAFPILARMKTRYAGRLSGGEQQMLTIARALMGNPDVLLLDEPSEGLAPLIVQAIGNLLLSLKETGLTILLAEQNMHFCLGIATHVTILDRGKTVYQSTVAQLRGETNIVKRYLAL
ncbi:ABC transporter ATP-binding protein [Paraburkholderia caribensis]|uniref:ABC transporter ATP-binding protein n=1 Tax=Paraburkholderia caribensis TaxID=75105 RepID=UPI00078D6094|nr:ABC transporter ATP-binding protein [Paraburkholderia caribensis]AMV48324.1 ABC transporter ATP-binding protein [Paraburkholderia caribensis]